MLTQLPVRAAHMFCIGLLHLWCAELVLSADSCATAGCKFSWYYGAVYKADGISFARAVLPLQAIVQAVKSSTAHLMCCRGRQQHSSAADVMQAGGGGVHMVLLVTWTNLTLGSPAPMYGKQDLP